MHAELSLDMMQLPKSVFVGHLGLTCLMRAVLP